MPEEIVSGGDTQEAAVPAQAGDAAGSTDTSDAQQTPAAGTAETPASAPAPVELPAELKDKYVEAERYQNLEKRLGSISKHGSTEEVERLIQMGLQAQEAQAQAAAPVDTFPDNWGTMNPQEQLKWLDDRSARIAEERFQNLIKPLADDVYNRQANELVGRMEQKYPDFAEHKADVWSYIESHPGLADNLNDQVFEDAYKVVTYAKAVARGEQIAIEKLKGKGATTAPSSSGRTKTVSSHPTSMSEAVAMAREELNA